MNILVVAPHADDEILGCGGVIARHAAAGDVVTVAVMTDASKGAPELYDENYILGLRKEAQAAHEFLGVSETRFFDFPAPRLDTYPRYKVAAALGELVGEIRPEVMFVPHFGDLHVDHGAVYNAALVAARPVVGCSVHSIYAYETLSETEWASPQSGAAFSPNHYVDISVFLAKKLDAMRCYESQLKSFPSPRSIEAIEALARYRGASVGYSAGESFAVVRTLLPA